MKRLDLTTASADASLLAGPAPTRSRTATGGFAKQLRATTKGTTPPSVPESGDLASPPPAQPTTTTATATATTTTTTTTPRTVTADRDVADATHSASIITRPVGRGLVSAAMRAAKQPQPQPAPAQPQPQPLLPQLALQPHVAPPQIVAATPAIAAAPIQPVKTPDAAPVIDSDASDDAPPKVAAPAAPTVDDSSTDSTPRTPLEQAVHDLLSQLGEGKHDPSSSRDDDAAGEQASAQKLAASSQPAAPAKPTAFAPAAPAAPVQQNEVQQQQSAHHAHIVIGDDANRVVMTVAVRGSAVNVTLKASDEHTAAALARNAGSLDDAMRAQKLDLEQFETPREAPRERQQYEQPERATPDPDDSTEPFELEEQV